MTDLIDYLCTAAVHQTRDLGSAVTMHRSRWAYCPAAALSGHVWRATGGLEVADVRALVTRRADPILSLYGSTRSD